MSDLNLHKLKLEVRKLQQDTRAWGCLAPTFITSSCMFIVAIVAVGANYVNSTGPLALAEARAVEARNKQHDAEQATAKLEQDHSLLEQRLSALQLENNAVQAALEQARHDVAVLQTECDELELGRQQTIHDLASQQEAGATEVSRLRQRHDELTRSLALLEQSLQGAEHRLTVANAELAAVTGGVNSATQILLASLSRASDANDQAGVLRALCELGIGGVWNASPAPVVIAVHAERQSRPVTSTLVQSQQLKAGQFMRFEAYSQDSTAAHNAGDYSQFHVTVTSTTGEVLASADMGYTVRSRIASWDGSNISTVATSEEQWVP